MDSAKVEDVTPTEITFSEDPKKFTYLDHLNILYSSFVEASRIKGGFTMQDCDQLLDAKETLEDFFTPQEGETGLPKVTRSETDALALMIKFLEAQQQTGVFSVEGSRRILKSITKLNNALTGGKTPAQKMAAARRNLKKKNRS